MKGKGCAGSTASGVRIGNSLRLELLREVAALARRAAPPRRRSPGRAGAGPAAAPRRTAAAGARRSGRTTRSISASCWRGVRPSGGSSRTLLASCCFRPPTRFMKNSSRLLSKMATNFSRSSRGLSGSSASCEHAGVELEPGQLAVDEQRPGITGMAGIGRRLVAVTHVSGRGSSRGSWGRFSWARSRHSTSIRLRRRHRSARRERKMAGPGSWHSAMATGCHRYVTNV